MKLILSEFIHLITKKQERNIWILAKFLFALVIMVTIYSILFHFLMMFENREFSWITGFYWTLTVMSTLVFGDITFATDLGKVFSIIVLMSGIVFLLTMLPSLLYNFFIFLGWKPELEPELRVNYPMAPKAISSLLTTIRLL